MTSKKKIRGPGRYSAQIALSPSDTQEAGYAEEPCVDFVALHKEDPEAYLDKKISWRFFRMDKGSIGKCTLKILHMYHSKLVELEGLTIRQIKAKNHNHSWDIKNLEPCARERAAELNIEEETLYQIALDQKPRLYGIWEENVFHILWLDKDHDKIYKCKNFNS